jgi:hypothetical protein
MRKIILTVMLQAITMLGSSQTSIYHPFPESSASWNFIQSWYCWAGVPGSVDHAYSIIQEGDTTITGQIYHKLSIPYWETPASACGPASVTSNIYKGCVRQDTAARKVFMIRPGYVAETLLYDFNLTVGDTITGIMETFFVDTVISIDSVLVDGSFRKRWLINSSYDIYLIEGIGSTYGLVDASPGEGPDLPGQALLCHQQDGTTVYPASGSCSLITGIITDTLLYINFSISPNPSDGNFRVNLGNIRSCQLILRDMLGNTIQHLLSQEQQEIQLSNLHEGLYILTITDDRNNSASKKLVCIK